MRKRKFNALFAFACVALVGFSACSTTPSSSSLSTSATQQSTSSNSYPLLTNKNPFANLPANPDDIPGADPGYPSYSKTAGVPAPSPSLTVYPYPEEGYFSMTGHIVGDNFLFGDKATPLPREILSRLHASWDSCKTFASNKVLAIMFDYPTISLAISHDSGKNWTLSDFPSLYEDRPNDISIGFSTAQNGWVTIGYSGTPTEHFRDAYLKQISIPLLTAEKLGILPHKTFSRVTPST